MSIDQNGDLFVAASVSRGVRGAHFSGHVPPVDIINPDQTPRPAFDVIREMRRQLDSKQGNKQTRKREFPQTRKSPVRGSGWRF